MHVENELVEIETIDNREFEEIETANKKKTANTYCLSYPLESEYYSH